MDPMPRHNTAAAIGGVISKLPTVGTTIFTTTSALAQQHHAINLSQGFPDFDCPPRLIELVTTYMRQGFNQYAPMQGVAVLRERIAEKITFRYGVSINPDTEITVTAGATQGLFTAIATLVAAGDEVIIFEPAYDSYAPSVELFGGIVKNVELTAPDFAIDWHHVGELITEKTKLIIVNTPTNPTSRIWTAYDFQELIRLTHSTEIFILSDEVYEHIVYDGLEHLSVLSYDALRERSFVITSFGKLFHTTGWKIGYAIAPEGLTREFRKIHQFNVFSVNTPIQYALADFLKLKDEYLQLADFFQEKRDHLATALQQTRFRVLPCEGTYFLLAEYSKFSDLNEFDFSRRLIEKFGLATIPVSAFYKRAINQSLIRFCFAKKKDTLEEAVHRIEQINRYFG